MGDKMDILQSLAELIDAGYRCYSHLGDLKKSAVDFVSPHDVSNRKFVLILDSVLREMPLEKWDDLLKDYEKGFKNIVQQKVYEKVRDIFKEDLEFTRSAKIKASQNFYKTVFHGITKSKNGELWKMAMESLMVCVYGKTFTFYCDYGSWNYP